VACRNVVSVGSQSTASQQMCLHHVVNMQKVYERVVWAVRECKETGSDVALSQANSHTHQAISSCPAPFAAFFCFNTVALQLVILLARDAQAKQALIIAQRLSVCPCICPSVCPRQLLQRGEYGIRLFRLFLINYVLWQTFCHDQSVPW